MKEGVKIKRTITLAVMVCLVLGGVLLNTKYQRNSTVLAVNESVKKLTDKDLSNKAEILNKKIHEKLNEQNFKLVSNGISFDPDKEIYIRVFGSEQYLNKVEEDIKKVVHELAQNTIFNDYPIGVYTHYEGPGYDALKLALEKNDPELITKIKTLVQKGLKINKYEEIGNILVEKQPNKLVIDVNTSIQKNDLISSNLKNRIEKVVKESLQFTEVMSILMAEDQTLEVNVYSSDREKIN